MASKKDKIKALRIAKELIKDDSFYHICHALRRVGWRNPHLAPSTNYLRDYISKQLGGNFMCLEGWHEDNEIAINMTPKLHALCGLIG